MENREIKRSYSTFLILLSVSLFCCISMGATELTITPYKYTDIQDQQGIPSYDIPPSARFTVPRTKEGDPAIVYYMSLPDTDSYPIAVFCGGSMNATHLTSIIHFHRYFLQECLDLSLGMVTMERWGIDGNSIDTHECMRHYTRSQIFKDHSAVIEQLQLNPPAGWNGSFIFVGCSEGGIIATSLTERYNTNTVATMTLSGASELPWDDELWSFIEDIKVSGPWWCRWLFCLPEWVPLPTDIPRNKLSYNTLMKSIQEHPTFDKEFVGMTYAYHADALTYPASIYEKIKTPFLVVGGAQDSAIHTSDAFVHKAREAGVPLTYLRISDMGHLIRHRPDVIEHAFMWLKQILDQKDR